MNKEAYVSFETAKLLKEKGFRGDCIAYYNEDGRKCLSLNAELFPLPCPTQAVACRWLREEKDIDIIPFHERLPHGCYWCRIEHNLLTAHQQLPIYSTYEDAVEAALEYCLTKLI